MKKIIGLLLALTLAISCFAVVPFSAGATIIEGDGGITDVEDDFDDTIAKPVYDMIAALGEITLASKADVEAARAAYDELTDTQKALVTNFATLTAAEKTITDIEAASVVIAQIDAIGTVTLDSETAINEAKTAYNALSADQKVLVTNYADLVAADDTLAELKEAKANKEAADAVIAKITAIGAVTLNSETAIDDARTAYDALSADQKALVTNYATLTAAEATLAELKEAKANQDAADAVIAKITAIGTVTSESEAAINEARTAYDELSDAQKALVTNYATLTKAEEDFAALTDVVTGDMDGDGKVTVSDVVEMRKCIMAASWTDKQLTAGDYDGNDTLTVSDVISLRQQIMSAG